MQLTPTALLATVLLTACQAPPPEPAADPAAGAVADLTSEIQAASSRLGEAFATGDGAAIAAHYTEDGQLLPPNNELVAGRADIQAFWEGAIQGTGVAGVALTTTEAVGHGDVAVEVGQYVLTDSTGAALDNGKFMVWWQRTAEGWRLHRDIWNSSRPPM